MRSKVLPQYWQMFLSRSNTLCRVNFTSFFGKFFIFAAAIGQKQFLLVAVGIVTVACGFYYYLKVVRAMYWPAPNLATDEPGPVPEAIRIGPLSRTVIILLLIATVLFGVYPQPLLNAMKTPRANVARKAIDKP